MFVLQVAARLLLIDECHDNLLTLRIQETTVIVLIYKEISKTIITHETLVFYVISFHLIRKMDDFFVVSCPKTTILIIRPFRSMFSL